MLQFFGLSGRQGMMLKAIAWFSLFCLTLALSLACSRLAVLPPAPIQDSGAGGLDRSGGKLAIGTNLNSVNDWSTEVPFLDAFKSARVWIPQCVNGETGCRGEWDTGEVDKLDLDEQGWVKSLPAPADAPEYTRVRTILFGGSGKFPEGRYVVLYDGEGTIEYVYDATKDEAASKPGRDVIDTHFANDGEGIH
ncbi:MAG: hypothetical protein HC772_00645 [Leptolyngbyaceae cyanobacterium CRU_2_3]|nr:hypothetical protein [Leptolyngbyaceae cyanobacterium CRU_2_3]